MATSQWSLWPKMIIDVDKLSERTRDFPKPFIFDLAVSTWYLPGPGPSWGVGSYTKYNYVLCTWADHSAMFWYILQYSLLCLCNTCRIVSYQTYYTPFQFRVRFRGYHIFLLRLYKVIASNQWNRPKMWPSQNHLKLTQTILPCLQVTFLQQNRHVKF